MVKEFFKTRANVLLNGWGDSRGTFTQTVISLYLIQVFNYLLPLITLPYLVRVLGPEKFGVVAFGQGLMGFLILIVNYGFDWSATREISTRRNDKTSVNRIAMSVWTAKLLLSAGSFLLLLLLVHSSQKLRDHSDVLFGMYGIVLGAAIEPGWLYQGLDQLPAFVSINMLVRVAGTTAVFLVVQGESDFVFYAELLSLQSIATGVIAAWIARRRFNLDLSMPSWRDVKNSLRNGWTLFLSTASVSLYTTGNAFILGLLSDNVAVGYYSAAERIVKSGSTILGPIGHAAFSRSAKLGAESREHALAWAKKLIVVTGGFGFMLSLLVFLLADPIVALLLGNAYHSSVSVVRILASYILINGVTNIWGIHIMLPFGLDRPFLVILLLAGLLNLIMAVVLVPLWRENGMATAVLSAGILVTVAQPLYLKRKGLLPRGLRSKSSL